MSHVTCHVSGAKCHFFLISGGASRGRVCYHCGLPCLISQVFTLQLFQSFVGAVHSVRLQHGKVRRVLPPLRSTPLHCEGCPCWPPLHLPQQSGTTLHHLPFYPILAARELATLWLLSPSKIWFMICCQSSQTMIWETSDWILAGDWDSEELF